MVHVYYMNVIDIHHLLTMSKIAINYFVFYIKMWTHWNSRLILDTGMDRRSTRYSEMFYRTGNKIIMYFIYRL